MTQSKKCSKCNELKPATQFSKRTISKDGLQPYCKKCVNERNHKKEVIEKRYEYNREYMSSGDYGIIYTITS